MKIGIAGIPALCANYVNALQLAAKVLQTRPSLLPHSRPAAFSPPEIEISLLPQKAAGWDALVLPGGGDPDPALLPDDETLTSYTQQLHPACHDVNPAFDRQQLLLLDWCIHDKKPVLGICRGMQLINLYFGGGLCQDLPTASAHRYLQYDQLHPTHAHPGSFLAGLYGTAFPVNSAHHQGILSPPAMSAPDLRSGFLSGQLTAIQWAPDGVIEGLVHDSLPVIGLQWHPERLCNEHARPDAIDGSLVFIFFLSLCYNLPHR